MVLFVNKSSNDNPYILVVNCDDESSENELETLLRKNLKRHIVKSKTVSKDGIELTFEIRLKNIATKFINEISDLSGVKKAVLVSYNGDYMG